MTGATRLDHPEGELRWVRDPRWGSVATPSTEAVLAAYEHLLVVAAHPDDECLGAGAFVADAASLGIEVTLLVLTDGEGSHPHSPTVGADDLGRRRRVEADRAAAVLAPTARVVHAGLPDGGLCGRPDEVVAAVRDLVRPGTLVLAPWTADGHPDHDAAGRGAAAAVADIAAVADGGGRTGIGHYLVWFWHWGKPDDLPWSDAVAVDATLDGLDRRARALVHHHSQHTALSSADGDETLLTDGVLAPSRRGFTTVVLPGHDRARADPVAHQPRSATFDEMFDAGDDPWSSTSWYERRKRALTLAVLRAEHYARVLDLGCSTGALTRGLAARADAVVAVDVSRRALDVARRDAPATIVWVEGEAPRVVEQVDGPLDLAVLSEVGYFLRPLELWLTLGRLLERLSPGGELVLVHWRHPTRDIPLDGPSVHEQVSAVLAPWSTLHHVEDDVLLDTYVVPR
ncbi:PIG-L family deacetylase [Knoellia sp. CPCC 206435]|uniref:PIG-L family deacetylase n=1 Tax=Knoellia terrae TaxID=3404797 RepID=UPI003B42A2CC